MSVMPSVSPADKFLTGNFVCAVKTRPQITLIFADEINP
jgi:hypothetical protein